MLEREQLPRAAEAGLHLVDAEERAVRAAERLCALEVAGRRQVHALPLDRLDEEEARRLRCCSCLLERVEVAEGHAVEAGQQRPKRAVNSGLPFAESEPSVSPWKPWSRESTRVRFVAARPSLSAASIASVPVLVKRQRSRRGGGARAALPRAARAAR